MLSHKRFYIFPAAEVAQLIDYFSINTERPTHVELCPFLETGPQSTPGADGESDQRCRDCYPGHGPEGEIGFQAVYNHP